MGKSKNNASTPDTSKEPEITQAPDVSVIETEQSETVEPTDIATAGQNEPGEVLTEHPAPAHITTEAEAIALVKSEYTVPTNVKVILVTEDRNVFWQENAGSAVNHAQKHNLKLFRLSCQDLVK